jgi:tetratricopeptide (TPR) repeat protein
MNLNRFDEAGQIIEQAQKRNLAGENLLGNVYRLSFIRGDSGAMQRIVAGAAGQAGLEPGVLLLHSDTLAYFGRFAKARDLTARAEEEARQNGDQETTAWYRAAAASREAAIGNTAAKQYAASAIKSSLGHDPEIMAALAFALAGDLPQAQKVTADLHKRFPADTLLNAYALPTIDATIELKRGNAARAIEILQPVLPYDLGYYGFGGMWPAYQRGQAYLQLKQGDAAAKEFQKILDHRGVVANSPQLPLAQLGLGRAYALQGETAKARTAFQDFFATWKDADTDIPILQQARVEYNKLH